MIGFISLFLLALARPGWGVLKCQTDLSALPVTHIDDLTTHHGDHAATSTAENARYLAAFDADPSPIVAVMHVDISNLKWQNDEGPKNKQRVNALENIYRKELFDRLLADPLIKRYLIEALSDFKTCRYAFGEIPEAERGAVQAAADKIIQECAAQHLKQAAPYIALDPAMKRRIQKADGNNRNIERWHSAGWVFRDAAKMSAQDTADVGALRSRLGREDKTLALRGDDRGAVDKLKEFKTLYGKTLGTLRSKYAAYPQLFEETPDGPVLSLRLLDLVRKKKPSQLAAAIGSKLKVKIDDPRLVQDLIDSIRLADTFSPTITQVKRIIPIPRGFTVSLDIKGVGAKNSQLLMQHLNESPLHPENENLSVLSAVRAARASEREATQWVKKLKNHVVEAAEVLAREPTEQVEFTGDDGLVHSERPFQNKSVDMRRLFLQRLISTSPVPANQFRIVMVAPKYRNSEDSIPETKQFSVIGDFETTLKKVANSFDPEHLAVSISVDTNAEGGGTYKVYITGEKVTPAEISRIQALVKKHAAPAYSASGPPEVIRYGRKS